MMSDKIVYTDHNRGTNAFWAIDGCEIPEEYFNKDKYKIKTEITGECGTLENCDGKEVPDYTWKITVEEVSDE
mgnify:CR=1 FL=1